MIGVCVTSTATELAPRMRGMSISMFGLCNGLIGAPLEPYLMALITDHGFGDPHRLYQSIAIVGAASLILGSLIFVLAWFTISRRVVSSEALVELVPVG
jgi:MFS family permease